MEENSPVKSGIRKYWDWRSRTYGLDQDRSIQVADKWKSVMSELAETGHGRRALDIGTGTGQFAFYLAEQGFEVDGVDISEKMIVWAREKALQANLKIDFKTGDAEHLDFEDNTFDVVVYDVLGDVVCGGFAVPLRRRFADTVYVVSSEESMSNCLPDHFIGMVQVVLLVEIWVFAWTSFLEELVCRLTAFERLAHGSNCGSMSLLSDMA